MKNSAILSSELIFLILTSLGKSWQSICNSICLALAIIDLEMVSKELLSSTNLSGAQALCIHVVTGVIVVSKDENLMFSAFHVVAPCFESFDDSQKLTVVGFVPCFRWNLFPQKKRYGMPLAQIGLSNYPIWPSFGS